MRVIFWGTPEFSVPSLEIISKSNHEIVGVISQPDRRRSRGKDLYPSPIKRKALEIGLNVITPDFILNNHEFSKTIENLKPDISIVVAYGKLLPEAILEIPKYGSWNSHASILPRWRGAAPIQWSIISGDEYTGISIMLMEKGLDTGPVLKQKRIKIDQEHNKDNIENKLSILSSIMLIETLEEISTLNLDSNNYTNETLKNLLIDQNNLPGEECYARLINKSDYLINWERTAEEIHRQIMGLYPGAYTIRNGKRLKILKSEINGSKYKNNNAECGEIINSKPGTIILPDKQAISITTGKGHLKIVEAQLEGKKRLSGTDLIQQLKVVHGDSFDS